MKTLTIYAFLLIATFVYTTKPVCFSDVAQSLIELHADNNVVSARINEINESFTSSHNSLEKTTHAIRAGCNRLLSSNKLTLAMSSNRISNFNNRKVTLVAANKSLAANNVQLQSSLVNEYKRLDGSKKDLKKASASMMAKTSELKEVILVLKRLKNFALDELSGTSKAVTQMTQQVVSKHGVSFIEKTNFHGELKSLLTKSETASKSLISTLIFMSRARYTDQKILKKVVALLDKIIGSNFIKEKQIVAEFTAFSKLTKKIISASEDVIANLRESVARNLFTMKVNSNEVVSTEHEITFLTKSHARKMRDSEFHKKFCGQQEQMMKTYESRYATITKRLNEMRSQSK